MHLRKRYGQSRRPLGYKEPEASTQAAKESCKEKGLKYGRKLREGEWVKNRGQLDSGVKISLETSED